MNLLDGQLLTRRLALAATARLGVIGIARALNPVLSLPLLGRDGREALDGAVAHAVDRLDVRAQVGKLSLEQKIAQLFVIKPEAVLGQNPILLVDDDLKSALLGRPVGGVMLKDTSFVDPDQVRNLTQELQDVSREACGLPMLIAADEEGGTVVRVADKASFGVEDPGNMRELGDAGDVELAESEALRVGSYLCDLGVNLDFAPVADVTDDQDSFVYLRSFGGDPQLVAGMVAAQVRGFSRAGTLCSPKHFPGIGGAVGDSHVESIFLDKGLDEMRTGELLPFAAAIAEDAPLIMVGHMTCTGVDPTMPASLSHVMVTEVLREEMGFDGVVITDSMGMAAVHELFSQEEMGVRALEAGCDLILCPENWYAVYDGIVDALASGRLSEERIDESVVRIVRLKRRIG